MSEITKYKVPWNALTQAGGDEFVPPDYALVVDLSEHVRYQTAALAERDAEIARLKDSLNDYEADPTVLADALAEARRQERERCARIADAESRKYLSDHREVCEDIAAAIRALGDEP